MEEKERLNSSQAIRETKAPIPFTTENEQKYSEFTGYGIKILVSSLFLRLIFGGIVSSMGVIIRILLENMDAGQGDLNWIGSLNVGFMLLIGPVAGAVESRYGARMTAIIGAMLSSIGTGSCFLVKEYHYLFFTYGVLGGSGQALLLTAAVVPVSIHFKNKRTLAQGLAEMGTDFGTSLTPLLVTFLDQTYGWHGMFLVLSAIQLNALVFGCLITPEYRRELICRKRTTEKSSFLKDSKKILKKKLFWILCFAGLLVNMVVTIPFVLLPVKIASIGLPPSSTSRIFLTIGGCNLILKPLLSLMIDHMQKYTPLMLALDITIMKLATLGLPYIEHEAFFYLYGIIAGFTIGTYYILQPLCVLDVVQKNLFSIGVGYFRFIVCASVMMGPPIAGWLVDIRHGYDWACFFSSSVGIAGALVLVVLNVFSIKEKKHNRQEEDICLEISENQTFT